MVVEIEHFIGGKNCPAELGDKFSKHSPHDQLVLANISKGDARDITKAIAAAKQAQPAWATLPAVQRGHLLHKVCNVLEERQQDIAEVVAQETGKSQAEASGEVGGAIALGRFYAGEGQRLYGRTTTSGAANKMCMTVRQPCGVAALITAANTPIANVAWKTFPALICGNAAVLKPAEDSPWTADVFARAFKDAGLPPGVLNVVHGFGNDCGAALVENKDVDVVSFTGSTGVGRWIGEVCGKRLCKVSLELGGKNPLIVCDDADLDNAVRWVCLSAFSNAGQRCAASSRILIFDSVYSSFCDKLVAATNGLKVGNTDDCFLGPVISERQLDAMEAAVKRAREAGANILTGGTRLNGPQHEKGWYMSPTLIDNVDPVAEISELEIFGPIACLYRVTDYESALKLANDSPYGLTACIHTRSFDRAMRFTTEIQSGVAVVNAGTYGSEPHMPFGGLRQSGNGTREPGTEALDIYCETKDIYFQVEPDRA